MNQKKNSNQKRTAGPQKRPAAPAQAEQTQRSRDEIRREQQLRSLKKRRRKKAILYLVLFLLLLCVGAVLTFTVFFHIAAFEVKGNSRYNAQEIIEASGIAKGENLFLCKTEQAAGRIAEKLPYVESVTIKRKLPDKLVLTVKEAQLKLAVQQGNSYLIMTGSGKVLEIGATELPEGAALLKGVEVKSASPGKQASFPPKTQESTRAAGETVVEQQENDQSQEKTVLDHLLDAVQETRLSGITRIDLSDLEDIRVVYQGRMEMLLGEDDQLAQKLKLGQEVIAREEESNPDKKGSINLTIPKKAFFSETVEPAQTSKASQPATRAEE